MTPRFELKPPVSSIITSFTAVGKCIYCGSVHDLTKEHVFPYSLQGKLVLPKASCKKCAAFTGAIEGRIAQMYANFRQLQNIQTRNPKQRKDKVIVKDPDGNDILIPNNAVAPIYPTIKFKLPGYYRIPEWRSTERKFRRVGTVYGILTGSPKDPVLHNIFARRGYSLSSSPFDPDSFALLMAKIGHCLAVGHYGVDNFEHILPRFILGEKEIPFKYSSKRSEELVDLSFFVGSFREECAVRMWNHEQFLSVERSTSLQGYYAIHAGMRLFAGVGGPTGSVVVGFVHEKNYDKLVSYEKEKIGFTTL